MALAANGRDRARLSDAELVTTLAVLHAHWVLWDRLAVPSQLVPPDPARYWRPTRATTAASWNPWWPSLGMRLHRPARKHEREAGP